MSRQNLKIFSTVGVSICGGVVHNLGQILVAMFLLNNAIIGYYMIVLSITGSISGIIIGLIGSKLIEKFIKLF